MTIPVFQENLADIKRMSFVIPSKYNQEQIPQPINKNIKIRFLKNAKFIAIVFSGRSTDKKFAKYQKILKKIISENNIKADLTNPINGYYNSPWTIAFFKRNEVLFRIK